MSPKPATAQPTITRIEPLPPHGTRVRVALDSDEPFEVALEAVERVGLGVGDRLDRTARTALRDEDLRWRVREAALGLLAHRVRTRAELRRRLLRKGFSARWIDACLDRLQQRGLLDDAAAAAAFVRDRLSHRPRGKARLAIELRAKGVSPDLAHDVVDRVMDDADVTDADLARAAAEKWVRSQDLNALRALADPSDRDRRERARRRLYGFLAQRGFRGDALRAAMDRAAELAREAASPD